MVLSSPTSERILMGYVLRERGGDRQWVRVDPHSGGHPYPVSNAAHATVWNDPVEAQEYADRFCGDVEVLPVYVHTEDG